MRAKSLDFFRDAFLQNAEGVLFGLFLPIDSFRWNDFWQALSHRDLLLVEKVNQSEPRHAVGMSLLDYK